MAGFEGADHVNSKGEALSPNQASAHWDQIEQDYRLLREFGIRTVRESVGWRNGAADLPDLRRLAAHAELAARMDMQVLWTIHHYGLPQGVDFFAPDFAARFAGFCEQVARCVARHTQWPAMFLPINEISFLSWAASATDWIHPYRASTDVRGFELKCRLVQAALRGCDAIWSVLPDARIVHTDPMIYITAAADASPELREEAQARSAQQYQAWDMLCGALEPGLGGAPHYLDVIGVNYYHNNQWEHPTDESLHWHLGHPRRRDPADMLEELCTRYRRPVFIAETGHVGEGRASWLDDIGSALQRCEQRGVPIEGVCLYPILDRHDWEDPRCWHRSGLWDLPDPERQPTRRELHLPFARRLRHWQSLLPATRHGRGLAPDPHDSSGESLMSAIVVFSHLRWDFVYQRPQHLLSRLARQFEVLFVEEPIPGAASPYLERIDAAPGVEVLRPHLPGAAPGFHDDHVPALRRLLAEHLERRSLRDHWLWFYTPMASPLAAGLAPVGIVYDCMDELSAFLHAPPELLQREAALFDAADLVFTGGASLYEAKKSRHPDVHCFPSSVDAAHFSRARAQGSPDAGEPRDAASPRLGFFGVIDERLDLALVGGLAEAHPDWSIVMVGPVVKIDPATLPKQPNIQWVGQRSYEELPELVAQWDVCLLPFALNESTRYISPTKTLEYLAADRPVVSTPVKDVARQYDGVVAIADGLPAFVAACERALGASPAEREAQKAVRAAVVAGTSWDATADAMRREMERVLAVKRAAHIAAPAQGTQAVS
ncbi:glycosyltransferase [Variovorax paradoxus]|nr:glycosyltransferase [Variovorax paradoxus]